MNTNNRKRNLNNWPVSFFRGDNYYAKYSMGATSRNSLLDIKGRIICTLKMANSYQQNCNGIYVFSVISFLFPY